MVSLVEVGENVILLRNAQGLTQEELAFRAQMSVSRLQDIEHGCRNTTADTLIRLSQALDVDSHVLGIFAWPEREILAMLHRSPRLPERRGDSLQICENITLLRKAVGLTQLQLADRSHMSSACLRDIEHGCSNMSLRKLLCISSAFGLSLLELDTCAMSQDELMGMVRVARRMAGLKV